MKALIALTILTGLIATACAPGNQGGSFANIPGPGGQSGTQRGRGTSAQAMPSAPAAPEAAAPADAGSDPQQSPHLKPGELDRSQPAYGDEDPGDFLVRPKNQAIHI